MDGAAAGGDGSSPRKKKKKRRYRRGKRWVCAFCATASVAKRKPERCAVCGSTFRDVTELEDQRDPG